MSLDYAWLREKAKFLYGLTIVALVLVFLLAKVSNGAQLSFDLGPINVQPAEFAKVTVLLALAAFLSEEASDSVSLRAVRRRAVAGRRADSVDHPAA